MQFLRQCSPISIRNTILESIRRCFADTIINLVDKGVINGLRKLKPGKNNRQFLSGDSRLYDYIHENNIFEFRPSEYVNDPFIISQHAKMVAVNVAIEVDIAGQVCSDSIGYNLQRRRWPGRFQPRRGARTRRKGNYRTAVNNKRRENLADRSKADRGRRCRAEPRRCALCCERIRYR